MQKIGEKCMKKNVEKILHDFNTNGYENFTYLYNTNGTKVIEHKFLTGYLIKISGKEKSVSDIQMSILNDLPDNLDNVSRIYYNQVFMDDDSNKTLEIIKKLSGAPKELYTLEETKDVIKATKELNLMLNKSSDVFFDSLPNLKDLFYGMVANTKDKDIKNIADKIMNSPSFDTFINSKDCGILVADLVTDNILLSNSINFIDLDPFIYAPKSLQVAILLSSNILLQESNFKNICLLKIEEYYKIWGKPKVHKTDLIALTIFPLLILTMKQVDYNAIVEDEKSLYYRMKVLLEFLLNEIKKL